MHKSQLATFLISALTVAILHPLPSAAADNDGFTALFNGKDLTGWDGNPDFWSVSDGILVGQTTPEKPSKGNTFLIWTGTEYKDFELHASCKLEGGNSGIQYRSKNLGNWVMAGYQCDIRTPVFDPKDPKNCLGKIYSEKEGRGQMALGGEKAVYEKDGQKNVVGKVNDLEKVTKAIEQGEWKDVVIIAKGNHILQKINGEIVCELTDEDENKRALSGQLGLQIHGGQPMKISFKNIQIKELK
ncbi:MAG: DUF1080 domain-containing protein [Verrucomicrobiota bacterium]